VETLIGDVPDDWTTARLGDVCDILAGPSGAVLHGETHTASGVPVVAPKDLKGNRIVLDGSLFVAPDAAERLRRYRLAAGDIVCARTGEIGRHALVSGPQAGYLFGTACLRLRAREPVGYDYLAYYLDHPGVRDWIDRNATGSAIPSLTAATLGALPFVLPPERVQTAVSEILGALDEQIAVHDRISRTAARLRDALLPLLILGSGLPQNHDHST
jgi:restriction endonuclease S subunit